MYPVEMCVLCQRKGLYHPGEFYNLLQPCIVFFYMALSLCVLPGKLLVRRYSDLKACCNALNANNSEVRCSMRLETSWFEWLKI